MEVFWKTAAACEFLILYCAFAHGSNTSLTGADRFVISNTSLTGADRFVISNMSARHQGSAQLLNIKTVTRSTKQDVSPHRDAESPWSLTHHPADGRPLVVLTGNSDPKISTEGLDSSKTPQRGIALGQISFVKPHRETKAFERRAKSYKEKSLQQNGGRQISFTNVKEETNDSLSQSGQMQGDCPAGCRCFRGSDQTVDIIDCSGKGLVEIPHLPKTSKKVYLQNNKIREVPCSGLRSLERLKTLDLSGNRISTLYRCSFTDLTSLQDLRLPNNNISSLGLQLFSHMNSLASLDLSKNKLSVLRNDTFHGLVSLVFLSLQGNSLRYVPGTFETGAFHHLTSLECLHLEGNQRERPDNFSYPDQALAQVPTLQRLWLDGFPQCLGPGFASLTQLKYLTFRGGQGSICSMESHLPELFFFHLAKDQPISIHMISCNIITIPPGMFKHVLNIHALDLTWNENLQMDGFEKASEGLQHSNLAVLNITHIVDAFQSKSIITNTTFRHLTTTKLKVLIVENCFLTYIHSQAIHDLPLTLENISFRNNYVVQADVGDLVRFRNLKVLDVSKQAHFSDKHGLPHERGEYSSSRKQSVVSALSGHTPSGIQNAFSKHLPLIEYEFQNFSRSIIDSIHFYDPKSSTFSCEETKTLRKDYNNVPNDPSEIAVFPLPMNLIVFNLSDIRLGFNIPQILFVNNKVLKYLDFSLNNCKCFEGPVRGLHSLQHLDLSRNWCLQMNPLFFSDMPSLKTLLLYENALGRSLAEDRRGITFSALPNLEKLDLSTNGIEEFSEKAFVRNRNLTHLDISSNALLLFRPSLANNKRLEILDLSRNRLTGFSERCCHELENIKKSNPNFTVRIAGNNGFLCNCDYLYFLHFLVSRPEVFEDFYTFRCQLQNGSSISYAQVAHFLPQLSRQCMAESIFVGVLILFFLVVCNLSVCAMYHYKKWQWKYLYYIGRSRLHIGSTHLTYQPLAHTFVTYDQENAVLRGLMRNVFRPRLRQIGVSTVLGEVDFESGPRTPSIAAAVTRTRKTLVFLSPNIFQDYERQLEFNLAIMHELYLRRPVLVPVVLLRQNITPEVASRDELGSVSHQRHETHSIPRSPQDRQYTNSAMLFAKMLRNFPPEISVFLKGQVHRCLVYHGDTEVFWDRLRRIILDD